ncbi:MAG: FAD-binding oxidoreductase [Pseudomonadota bacterium]
MAHPDALAALREVVGPAGVVDRDLWPAYLEDERGLYHGEAACIVRPATTDEVSAVLGTCARFGLAVVPQGGNTGYCGGATPDDASNQIVLSLSRMNRVRAVDPVGFTMTVEAGVILANAHAAAEQHALLFPLSMGSEGSCQIGGNLATNAGGLAVLRYGNTRDLVLGIEAVLPDGTVIDSLSGLRKDNTGYDLKNLLIGSEGTLGVITAAVLKLFPQPVSRQTAFLALADAPAMCRLLADVRRTSGDTVTSFEYIARPALDLVLEHIDGAADPLDAAYDHYVLLELSSGQSEDDLRSVCETILMRGMENGDVLDGVVAESGRQRDRLWHLRESIPEAEKHAGRSVKHDISVTVARMADYLAAAPAALAAVTPARTSVYGHVGDGNLHYNVLAPEGVAPETFRAAHGGAISDAVHDLAVSMGGSFSAEHGIGKLKKPALARYKSPAELAAMRAIKKALDPDGRMNPGKLFD